MKCAEPRSGLDAYAAHRRYFARVQNAAPLNRLLYVDLKTFLPCLNLITTDKTSMAANLEVQGAISESQYDRVCGPDAAGFETARLQDGNTF